MKKNIFLFLTLVDGIGDYIFLSSIPIFLYKEYGSISSMLLMGLIINISVIINKKNIQKMAIFDPIKVVVIGQFLMAIIEIITLLIFQKIKSPLVIIISIFPLALTYNSFAAIKYYRIYDYFKEKKADHFEQLFSSFLKIGSSLGLGIGVIILDQYGISSILVIDIISFLFFGLGLKFLTKNHPALIHSDLTEKSIKHKNGNTKNIFSLRKQLIILFSLYFFSTFIELERSTSLGIINQIMNYDITKLSLLKTIFFSIGCLLPLFFPLISKKKKFSLSLSAFAFTLIFFLTSLFQSSFSYFSISLLFLLSGLSSSLLIPFHDSIFKMNLIAETDLKSTTHYWIDACVIRTLIIIATFFLEQHFSPLQTPLFTVFTIFFISLFFSFYSLKRKELSLVS
jgi:MFS family permease